MNMKERIFHGTWTMDMEEKFWDITDSYRPRSTPDRTKWYQLVQGLLNESRKISEDILTLEEIKVEGEDG